MHVRIINPIQKVQKEKKKVCAYARVSTDSRSQGESLENQKQYYENIISNNPDYEYVGMFADRGITGTTENRPEFQRMLQLCREGKVDLIITKSISRFARNTAIMLQIVRELKDIDVEVRFEKENINTLSGDGELMITVLSSFAQEESKNVSDNLKWSARKKFEREELMINATRFLGYDKDEYGDLIINREESEIVKRIYEDYISGKGSFVISKELNSEGISTVGNTRWHDTTILEILKNEKYKGDALLQKYYTPNHFKKSSIRNNGVMDSYYIEDNHSPIISREMWEQVQDEIKRRAKGKGNIVGDTDKYIKKYPLSGMLYCSKCGAALNSKGEVLLTILSSLAQDESRSISENSTWGIRRKFEQGKVSVNCTKFLGYDKGEDGNLIINEKQAKIVRRIYKDYLDGKGANRIARELEEEGVSKWNGKSKWYESSIRKMLSNEKYKGDALLQKTYTVDFLTKKRVENNGEVPQYYVEESHPAIIDKEMWEAVQLEIERRRTFAEKYNIRKFDYATLDNSFAGRVICGHCGSTFGRKVWNSTDEKLRRVVWRCNKKYEVKGEKGCESKHIDDRVLYKVFVEAFNVMVQNKDYFMEKWKIGLQSENVLVRYKSAQFIEILEGAEVIEEFDIDLYYKVIEKMTVFEGEKIIVNLLDGTEIEVVY